MNTLNGIKGWFVVLSLTAAVAAQAAAPQYVPLQGVLTDADGVPISAAVSVGFGLYAAETGGTALWTETQTVTVQDGLFVAYLGTVQTLDLNLFRDNGALWLGVKVGSDLEMARVRLGSAPFSGYAEYCGHVSQSGLPAGVVVGAKACSSTDKVTGIDASGGLVCGADLGYKTETELATVLDTHYRAIAWVPAWTDVTGKPAGLVVGAQACSSTDKMTGVNASGVITCAPDVDTNTTYTASDGITLAGTNLTADATVQRRTVTPTCAAGSVLASIAADGTPTCVARVTGSLLTQFRANADAVTNNLTGYYNLTTNYVPTVNAMAFVTARCTFDGTVGNQLIFKVAQRSPTGSGAITNGPAYENATYITVANQWVTNAVVDYFALTAGNSYDFGVNFTAAPSPTGGSRNDFCSLMVQVFQQ